MLVINPRDLADAGQVNYEGKTDSPAWVSVFLIDQAAADRSVSSIDLVLARVTSQSGAGD